MARKEKSDKLADKAEKAAKKAEKDAKKAEKAAKKAEKDAKKAEKTAEKTEKTGEKTEKTAKRTEKAAKKSEKTAKKTEKVAEKTEIAVDTSRKKVKEFDINTNIKVAYKTGKIIYGKKQILREVRRNPFKMIIIANNCPKVLENQLNYYNTLLKNGIFIYRYNGSSWDLGLACGKPYMISMLGVIDPGDSELLSLKTKRR
jgi:large subunit ribosomal protein L30e